MFSLSFLFFILTKCTNNVVSSPHLKMGDRFNILSQMEHLQSKYQGTGHADATKFEWVVHQHRDTHNVMVLEDTETKQVRVTASDTMLRGSDAILCRSLVLQLLSWRRNSFINAAKWGEVRMSCLIKCSRRNYFFLFCSNM